MNRKRTAICLALSILFFSLLTACGQSSLEVGMMETNCLDGGKQGM